MNLDPNSVNPEDVLKNLINELKKEDSVVRVQLNDQRLMKLAEYDATKGYMHPRVTPEELQDKFFEFKGRVKKGCFTLKTLEDNVYSRWGITEEDRNAAIRNELTSDKNTTVVTGFNINDINVGDIKEDSAENR